jgi:hypothetical protein
MAEMIHSKALGVVGRVAKITPRHFSSLSAPVQG